MGQFLRHLFERHHFARTGRTFHLEAAAVVHVILAERLNDQEVDGHPDRPAPVRVTAEQVGGRFAGLVIESIFLAIELHY